MSPRPVPAVGKHFYTAAIDRAALTDGADGRITISTIAEDREGDVVVPEGGLFGPYRKNPVVMWAHSHHDIPVGRALSIDVTPGRGITSEFTFLKNDAFADRVKNAVAQGVINAASIGFRPLAWEPLERGWRYTRWELLEWSFVPVPAQADAVRTLKSLGLYEPSLAALATQLKAGRVLSGPNEDRLRQIMSLLQEILDQQALADDDDDADEKGITVVGALPDTLPMLADGRLLINEDVINRAVHEAAAQAVEQLTGRLADPYEPAGALPVIEMSDDALTTLVTGILKTELEVGINTLRGRVD